MEVRYERDSLETVRYIDLPAYARIHGQRYPVDRWSLQGFYVIAESKIALGDTLVEFVLPFATHEASVKVRCRPAPAGDGQIHFAFLDLQQAVRKLMRDYFESSLTSIAPDERADYALVEPLASQQKETLNRALLRRLLFHGALAVVLLTTAWFLWREFSYVYSLRGTVMGDLVQYRSPDQNYIKKIYVKDGDRVAAGQLLYELNHDAYDQQLAQLRQWEGRAEDEVRAARDSINEEGRRSTLYTGAARQKLAMLEAERTGLLAQVQTAEAVLGRQQAMFASGLVPQESLDIARGNVAQLEAQAKELESQVALQRLVVDQSKENRFLSTSDGMTYTGLGLSSAGGVSGATSGGSSLAIFDIKGNLPALNESLASKRTAVEQIRAQEVQLESQIQRAQVHALGAGVVNHVNRRDGDSVNAGDYVLSLTDDLDANQTYVAARFTAEDARFIAYGMPCDIISVTRGERYAGKVAAIGHSGLGQGGSISPDEETALDELVVKFQLPQGSDLRGGDPVYVKLHRAWKLAGFLDKLR